MSMPTTGSRQPPRSVSRETAMTRGLVAMRPLALGVGRCRVGAYGRAVQRALQTRLPGLAIRGDRDRTRPAALIPLSARLPRPRAATASTSGAVLGVAQQLREADLAQLHDALRRSRPERVDSRAPDAHPSVPRETVRPSPVATTQPGQSLVGRAAVQGALPPDEHVAPARAGRRTPPPRRCGRHVPEGRPLWPHCAAAQVGRKAAPSRHGAATRHAANRRAHLCSLLSHRVARSLAPSRLAQRLTVWCR